MIGSTVSDAQIQWARYRAKYYNSQSFVMASPYYRSQTYYAAQNESNLYERVTARFNSMIGGVLCTNVTQEHYWSRRSGLEDFVTTLVYSYAQTNNGTGIWQQLSPGGRSAYSPPADVGSTSYWVTNWAGTRKLAVSGQSTWYATASSNNTAEKLLIFAYKAHADNPDRVIGGTYNPWDDFAYAKYRVPSNAVNFIMTPTAVEMYGPFCRSLSFTAPLFTGGGTLQYLKGMGQTVENYSPPGPGITECLASNSTAISVTIPDATDFTNTWTVGDSASFEGMEFADATVTDEGESSPASLASSSPPLPPGDGGDGSWSNAGLPELRYKLIKFNGTPNRTYLVSSSTNMVDWEVVGVGMNMNDDRHYRVEDWRVTESVLLYKIVPLE